MTRVVVCYFRIKKPNPSLTTAKLNHWFWGMLFWEPNGFLNKTETEHINLPMRASMIIGVNDLLMSPFLVFLSFPLAFETASVSLLKNISMAALIYICWPRLECWAVCSLVRVAKDSWPLHYFYHLEILKTEVRHYMYICHLTMFLLIFQLTALLDNTYLLCYFCLSWSDRTIKIQEL